jgi:hypothetical protein
MWARTEWSSDPFGLLLRCLTPLTLLFPFRSQYRQGGWRLTDTDRRRAADDGDSKHGALENTRGHLLTVF